MSRMEGSAEASMEEILASIRKIIADDPTAKATPDAPETAASGLPLPTTRDALTGDSATTASRSGNIPFFRPAAAQAPEAMPAPSMLQRSRAAAIDDDLAGLIDSPAPASQSQDPVSPVEAAREKWANLINPPLVTPAASAPRSESTPAAATPAAPSPVTSGLFAPRKGGFYPPQEPAAAPVRAPDPIFQPAPAPAPATSSPGFIPIPRSVDPIPAPASLTPLVEPIVPVTPSAPEPAPVVFTEAAVSTIEELPADTASAAAAARALDNLVAGFAKTTAPGPAPQAFAPAPVVPTVAVESLPSAPEALVGRMPTSPAPATGTVPPAAAGRTLEDVVAEMVRPMLEKWIDANMPRIVERALKLDTSNGPKTGA